MQLQANSPIQIVVNLIPARYVDSPTTVITDLLKISVACLGIKYLMEPILKTCAQQISKSVTPILQHRITQYATASISMAGGVYIAVKAYYDETPTHHPVQIPGVSPNTPGLPFQDRFL